MFESAEMHHEVSKERFARETKLRTLAQAIEGGEGIGRNV